MTGFIGWALIALATVLYLLTTLGFVNHWDASDVDRLFLTLQLTYAGLGTLALILGLGVRRRLRLVRLPTIAFLTLMGAYWFSTAARAIGIVMAEPNALDAGNALGIALVSALAIWTAVSIRHLLLPTTKREFHS